VDSTGHRGADDDLGHVCRFRIIVVERSACGAVPPARSIG
jgi:hypothetical protein